MKIRPVETKLFHADEPRQTDRQTDRETDRHRHDKANSRFSQFCDRA